MSVLSASIYAAGGLRWCVSSSPVHFAAWQCLAFGPWHECMKEATAHTLKP